MRDNDHELLGSVRVGKWDDDDDGDSDTPATKLTRAQSEQRKDALKQLEKHDRSKKRKMHLDSWDAMLDEGKKKKVKQKKEATSMAVTEPKNNPFHRIQSGMQIMNRGKAKGWERRNQRGNTPHGRKNSTP